MQIGPYTLIRELGRGGMAQVWLAHRVWEDGERRPCVIKFPRRNAVTDEGMLRQFLEEWRLAIRLRHNNIVSVFDAGVHEGLPYLVMNYVAGKDLAEIIRTLSRLGKRFDVKTAVYVVRQLGQALAYAHGYDYKGVPQQIVHRDVSSKNAMIDGWGGVLLMDFGVATSVRTQTSRIHVKGTLAYMAPEHYLGQASAISDVYGLGTILWEMLAGRPFRGGLAGEELIAAIVAGTVEPVGRELPELVQRMLDGMLEPVASERIKLREVLVAFEEFPSRRLLLQEMMATYFGRAGKRTGLSSVHFAASKELTDTLAVVKVSGVSMSEIRRRKVRGQPREIPLGFVPGRKEDTGKIDPRAIVAGADDDLDDAPDGVASTPTEGEQAEGERAEVEQAEVEQAEVEQAEVEQAEVEQAEVEQTAVERDDDPVSTKPDRGRTPAGTVRAPRAAAVEEPTQGSGTVRVPRAATVDEPTPATATVRVPRAPAEEESPPATARVESPWLARAPLDTETPKQSAGEADASGWVPPGDTLRSPGSGDPRPPPQATMRLQSPLAADVEVAGRTEFLPLPTVQHAEPPPSPPRVDERPRAETRPQRRLPPLAVVIAPMMLLVLGMTAWSLWPSVSRDPRGSETEPAGPSVTVASKTEAVVTAIAEPSQDARLDTAEDLDETPARTQALQGPMPAAQPESVDDTPTTVEPEPIDTTAPIVEPEPAVDVPGPAVEPVPSPTPEPEPVPQAQPAKADEDTGAKQPSRPSKPKPVPKLKLVVRRGLMVDHAEVRVDRGRVEQVPAKGWAIFRVSPGTHTLRYRSKPDGEWKEKRQAFSPNMAYSAYVELSGLRIDGAPAEGKSP